MPRILISVYDFLSFISPYIGSDEAEKQDKVMSLFQIIKHNNYNPLVFSKPGAVPGCFFMFPLDNNFPLFPLIESQVKKHKVNCCGSLILNQQTCQF